MPVATPLKRATLSRAVDQVMVVELHMSTASEASEACPLAFMAPPANITRTPTVVADRKRRGLLSRAVDQATPSNMSTMSDTALPAK